MPWRVYFNKQVGGGYGTISLPGRVGGALLHRRPFFTPFSTKCGPPTSTDGLSTSIPVSYSAEAKMSLVFDEYGRPFIILREQQAKSRLKGLEAQKVRAFPDVLMKRSIIFSLPGPHTESGAVVRTLHSHTRPAFLLCPQSNILAARSVSQILRTSFGPKGK